jgi:hypothetical protein
VSDPSQLILRILEEDGGELHWTVIQDRLLRSGAVDPFVVKDVRGIVLRSLAELTKAGEIQRTGKGSYRFEREG